MDGSIRSCLKDCSPMFRVAALVALFVLGISTSFAQTKTPLTQADKAEIDKILTAYLRDLIDYRVNIPASRKKGYVRASADPDTGLLLIDLGTEYLPRSSVIEVEDFQNILSTNAHSLVEDVMTVRGVMFLYGGKEIYYYFPDEKPKPRETKTTASTALLVTGAVVLNAGHEYFRIGAADSTTYLINVTAISS